MAIGKLSYWRQVAFRRFFFVARLGSPEHTEKVRPTILVGHYRQARPSGCATPCTDGNTKAITAEDTARENHVIRDEGVPRSPTSTLPATERWVGELLADFGGVAIEM